MAEQTRDLSKWALLSIATAIVVIALKLLAWQLTGSVGLLSDAAESVVNLVAAVVGFFALRIAARPADDDHNFGHVKSEYFAAVIEGVMIVVAAVIIIVTAVDRLIHPRELESVGLGLAVSVIASVINAAVAWQLIRVGRRHRSLTLEADGKHLMTDVWTTAGVIVGVAVVAITGWAVLDPIIAIAVAVNIIFVGYHLVRRSTLGLMDTAVPEAERAEIDAVLDRFRGDGIDFHDVRTREAGHLRYVQLHMLVPGDWSVQRGHDLLEDVEAALHAAVDDLVPTIHLEPIEDPRSYEPWRR
ncbi:cation diffusion facilitator family transporter [Gordonia neofelifaecis]|uniref:Cation diffusion facilitator family transporter n=1 Tax=Gordonia neofelifaecis NRRL B-59395 TaxID=644548 RepID=F1YN71_9ACTN|nr:cation diffusion facilitator family transporter [Gordonia neofelifaecis]EGD53782.1 cation diffusion facilitator family transporter [Gordonia neofelifaecis NRRL B-59395]